MKLHIAGITGLNGETMPRKLSIFLWMLSIAIMMAVAGEWGEEESYTEWSLEQVDAILSDSPWVGLSPAAPPIRVYASGLYTPLYYQARLLTARPIREGMLQLISLGMCSSTVDIEEFNGRNAVVEKRKKCLQEFIQSHPNDVRVKGDEQQIILGVTLKEAIWGGAPVLRTTAFDPYYEELTNDDRLSDIDSSEISNNTSLTANKGKRVQLVRYATPGTDRLGTKLYFPRYLPDGTPLVTAKDSELVLETRINDTKIRVRFDLKKMLYKGKLEF